MLNESNTGIEEEELIGSEFAAQSYDPRLIRIDKDSFPVFQIMRKVEKHEINLQPDFQRNFVWDEIRQSRLIESMLMRIPLPSFYVDATNDGQWLVVDGLQRLSTLNDFINEDNLTLTGLEFLESEIGKKRFSQIPRHLQRRLEETSLFFYIIRPETPTEAKFTIFRRLNTGGLVLSSQEIRHCLFQGKSTRLLRDLASSNEFKTATDNSIPDERMADMECILRFFAFYLTDYKSYKKPDLDTFLGDTMKNINAKNNQEIISLKESFIGSMLKAIETFGKYAFRKIYKKNGRKNPINKALFETWSVSLSAIDIELIKKHKEKIVSKFIDVINNDQRFNTSITQGTSDVSKVHYRFSTVENLIKESIRQ
ncbi:DUF262 domain-containing protein [Candidatus Magnetobacterium casense]|uniref:DUF262 domain-containing protein n=1 Tax=Candidatus Magnetobacterium casense TaxID=1455061 RepID=UPI00138E1562|nr:DUF262 domain-containing protein [Candidatus Magnetobacterium casensis]